MKTWVSQALDNGGTLKPLYLQNRAYHGAGFMNPTICVTSKNELLVNLRHINYTLYHSEHLQQFPSHWGPLAYLHPENDHKLKTINYLCELDNNLEIIRSSEIDTSALDVEPMWEFHGLEDGRLVEWDNNLYLIGVRRDTTPNGQGRMEYQQLAIDENWNVREIKRKRIPAPQPDDSYCEKNWMPIPHMPHHFVKWTSPTEVVSTITDTETVHLTHGKTPPWDLRGGTQVIQYKNYNIAIVHEVTLFNNYLGRKDGIYRHRLVVWDEEFNLFGYSPNSFSFLDGRIEFATGAVIHNERFIVTFGFQDNAAFVVSCPLKVLDAELEEALNV